MTFKGRNIPPHKPTGHKKVRHKPFTVALESLPKGGIICQDAKAYEAMGLG